ncbi:hypothetical protein B0H10DRAFT_2168096 [Mycena sp. CBHHK59/15]|nr:hypothetical protein B0H10DRAFT_2168096 [Mycena sp. CBHHK59/15]
MAPTSKPKEVPEGFIPNADRKRLQCLLCTAHSPTGKEFWLDWKNQKTHLNSDEHICATRQDESQKSRTAAVQKQQQEDLERQHQAEVQFTGLHDVRIPLQERPARVQTVAETEMWDQLHLDPQSIGFDLGINESQHQYDDLHGKLNSLWNAGIMWHDTGFVLDETCSDSLVEEDDTDEFLAKIMQNAEHKDRNEEWSPYPSKMLFLIDTLDNLPWLHISNSLMKVFLWILKEGGAQDAPSFDHLCKVQKELREKCGVPTTQYKSAKGNIFHMNDPQTLVAKDWANPETCKLIHVYPEIPEDGIIHEIWHAQKWCKDMDLDNLSPMYDAKRSHFYVNELAHMNNGKLGTATVIDNSTVMISAGDLETNYLDLEFERSLPGVWADNAIEKGYPQRMPNPKWALVEGGPLHTSFVDYFGDNVSGNHSKSWNKHWNAYMTHRNLPRVLLQLTHKEPVKVRDAETNETTQFCIHANGGPSDNPMQSEISSHIGSKGNYFCRKCETGGTTKEKETDACFHALFKILAELKKQVGLACARVAQPIKNTQTDTSIKDAYTQYWISYLLEQFKEKKTENPNWDSKEIQEELIQWTLDNEDRIYSGFLTLKGFDPTKDTPVEILHTILLGVVKYIWHGSHTSWSTPQKEMYALHLQSTNTDANYIMQYVNSLIGCQFKTTAQTNVFHVHGIVTDEQFATWRAVGELAALIWFPEIWDLKQYCNDVYIAAGNVLDAFTVLDPTKIISKIKLHLLIHTPEDIVAFGPLVGVATEIFECFNAIFCFCSILTNHLAPSHDIALQLADQEGHKHRLTGGWWPTTDGNWERAGTGVRGFLHTHPVLQKLVGWTVQPFKLYVKLEIIYDIGSVKLVPLPERRPGFPKPKLAHILMNATNAAKALNCTSFDMSTSWYPCRQVIDASLNECSKGSWVFAKSLLTGEVIVGQIDNILDNGKTAVVILDVFQVSAAHADIFRMPILTRCQSDTIFLIIPALDIKFLFNVQYDCCSASCAATGSRPHMQERVESGVNEKFIVHKPMERFIIDSHTFHNAHLLHEALPQHLTAPMPLFADQKAKHSEIAIGL